MAPTPTFVSLEEQCTTTIVLPKVDDLRAVTDAELTALLDQIGFARRSVDAIAVALAGEVARRSSRDLGHTGLAARNGLNTPEKLIQRLTGVTLTEAKNLTGASAAFRSEADAGDETDPACWKAPIAEALRAGLITAAAAHSITFELSATGDRAQESELLTAATALVEIAIQTTPEETRKAARVFRDHLDPVGVAEREEHRRAQRSMKWFVQADGMTRLAVLLDPESAAIVIGVIEAILWGRRGPRFREQNATSRSVAGSSRGPGGTGSFGGAGSSGGPAEIDQSLEAQTTHETEGGATPSAETESALALALAAAVDDRTPEQAAADALVDLAELATRATGTDIDQKKLIRDINPGVRLHVTAEGIETGVGTAHFEGQEAAVSITTAERIICNSGTIPIVFYEGRPIDVGKTNRLHSVRQRIAMAAYWGGCPWTGCDRPPSMTEAHHPSAWNGCNTTLINGIPLCRFHHMQLHNGGWKIIVDEDGNYWLIPPPSADRISTPIQLKPKNPLRVAAALPSAGSDPP